MLFFLKKERQCPQPSPLTNNSTFISLHCRLIEPLATQCTSRFFQQLPQTADNIWPLTARHVSFISRNNCRQFMCTSLVHQNPSKRVPNHGFTQPFRGYYFCLSLSKCNGSMSCMCSIHITHTNFRH